MRQLGTRILTLAALLVALPGTVRAQEPTPADVTLDEFAGLSWLEGLWIGTGGGHDPFYEGFRFIDARTIEQTVYTDSTFNTARTQATMELRGGHVLKFRDGTHESTITRLAGDTIGFERAPSVRPGFSWIRRGPDEWVAILERPRGLEPVTYVLRRADGR